MNEAMTCPPLSAPSSVFQPSYEGLKGIAAGGAGAIDAWMDDIHRCGVRRLLVQYVSQLVMTAKGTDGSITRFTPTQAPHNRILVDPYPSDYPDAGAWVARELLRSAHQRGVRMDVGLVTVTPQSGLKASWTWLSQTAIAPELAPWLRRLLAESQAVAHDWLQVVAAAGPAAQAWQGWYLSHELDDISWTTAPTRALFVELVRALCTILKQVDPDKPIAMSSYAGTALALDQAPSWWDGWLGELEGVDEWLWQDGTGAMHRALDDARALSEAIRSATLTRSRAFTPIAELFHLNTNDSASAVSDAEGRLLLASDLATRKADDRLPGWMCFDIPENVLGKSAGAQMLRPCFLQARPDGP